MGWRFRRSFRILPGVRLNVSKTGPSLSVGPRGFTMNLRGKRIRRTVSLPGTGLSYTTSSEVASSPTAARALPPADGVNTSRGFPIGVFVLGFGLLVVVGTIFQAAFGRPTAPAPSTAATALAVTAPPAPARPTCTVDGISQAVWLPPVSGDRPHVQVTLAKTNTRPVAITDVLRRCLQQIVDTGQIAQAVVAVALQPDGRSARLADGSEGLVYVPFEKRFVPSKQYRQPAVAPAVSPRTTPSTRSSPSAPAVPPGATAQCRDGSYSHAATHRGACSRHGGVSRWL